MSCPTETDHSFNSPLNALGKNTLPIKTGRKIKRKGSINIAENPSLVSYFIMDFRLNFVSATKLHT